ncbi:MAG TPA: Na+/H+ antiporter subunit E [Bacilli bacterium]|nr:Na+/H+ antiporter subunit E [Bacilli bacterium]
MAFQILINLIIAIVWMFLNNDWSPVSFVIGYFIGIFLLFLLRRFLPNRFYLTNVIAVIKLVLIFIRELILSNISVLKLVLAPNLNMQPGIFAYKTELKSDWEITILSSLITLTPGTLVIDVSDDNSTLYIHAIDVPDAEETIQSIKDSFEKAIMEVSR